jgi:hypothetical protein
MKTLPAATEDLMKCCQVGLTIWRMLQEGAAKGVNPAGPVISKAHRKDGGGRWLIEKGKILRCSTQNFSPLDWRNVELPPLLLLTHVRKEDRV